MILLSFVVTLSACGGGSDTTQLGAIALPDGGDGGVYVALGDSIAAGVGASDPETVGYPALVAAELREQSGSEVELVSLARGGATTQEVIDQQLDRAIERMDEGNVLLVTVTIGGNDLNAARNAAADAICLEDMTRDACPVGDVLVGTEERLDTILGELDGAAGDAVVAVQVYPNLFSGTGHVFEAAAGQAFGELNEVILDVAARHDVLVADPRDAFAGQGGELTHTLDPTPDFHPNDAGYDAIAAAFLDALGVDE